MPLSQSTKLELTLAEDHKVEWHVEVFMSWGYRLNWYHQDKSGIIQKASNCLVFWRKKQKQKQYFCCCWIGKKWWCLDSASFCLFACLFVSFFRKLILLYFTCTLISSLDSWVEDRHCLVVVCLIIPCNFDWRCNMHWEAAGNVCQLV